MIGAEQLYGKTNHFCSPFETNNFAFNGLEPIDTQATAMPLSYAEPGTEITSELIEEQDALSGNSDTQNAKPGQTVVEQGVIRGKARTSVRSKEILFDQHASIAGSGATPACLGPLGIWCGSANGHVSSAVLDIQCEDSVNKPIMSDPSKGMLAWYRKEAVGEPMIKHMARGLTVSPEIEIEGASVTLFEK